MKMIEKCYDHCPGRCTTRLFPRLHAPLEPGFQRKQSVLRYPPHHGEAEEARIDRLNTTWRISNSKTGGSGRECHTARSRHASRDPLLRAAAWGSGRCERATCTSYPNMNRPHLPKLLRL